MTPENFDAQGEPRMVAASPRVLRFIADGGCLTADGQPAAWGTIMHRAKRRLSTLPPIRIAEQIECHEPALFQSIVLRHGSFVPFGRPDWSRQRQR